MEENNERIENERDFDVLRKLFRESEDRNEELQDELRELKDVIVNYAKTIYNLENLYQWESKTATLKTAEVEKLLKEKAELEEELKMFKNPRSK